MSRAHTVPYPINLAPCLRLPWRVCRLQEAMAVSLQAEEAHLGRSPAFWGHAGAARALIVMDRLLVGKEVGPLGLGPLGVAEGS